MRTSKERRRKEWLLALVNKTNGNTNLTDGEIIYRCLERNMWLLVNSGASGAPNQILL